MKDWLYSNIWRPFKYGIKNLVRWFPVIWCDRDWDYWFIYKILQKKLDNTSKFLKKYGCHKDALKDAERIEKCVFTLNRLLKDEYHEMVFKHHDRKWGELELKTFPSKDHPGAYGLTTSRPNANTPELRQKEREEFRRCSNHQEYMVKQDNEFLFDTMKRYIRTWWD